MRRITAGSAAPQHDDAGLSLIEVMMTMTVLSVVTLVFTTGIVQVYSANRRMEAQSVGESQLHAAFQRFDRELRYGSSISEPGIVGQRHYVDFAEADPTQCVRLRLDANAQPNGEDGAGVLQLIRWKLGTPPTGTSAWTTIASNLVVDTDPLNTIPDTGLPFATQAAGSAPYASDPVGQEFRTAFQRLRIHLTARFAGIRTGVDTTFTAVNSAKATQTNACENDWLRT
jgi:prepilin-type N-terminal cleavage/methylation domain-containing protein